MRFTPLSLILALIACGSPSGASDDALFKWTFEGQTITAVDIGAVNRGSAGNSYIMGRICSSDAIFGITLPSLAVGSYQPDALSPDERVSASYAPDGNMSDLGRIGWVASGGSLSISALSETRVAGHFDLVMMPSHGNTATGTRRVTGQFDSPIGAEPVC